MRRWPPWVGLAALLGVVACVFEPDLSRFPACDARGACPAGWTCLAPEGVCLPNCGERGPCPTDGGDPDAQRLVLAEDGPGVGVETASYLHRFQARGGTPPHVFSLVGEPPPGLSLDARGVLSGRPALAGDFPLTVEVVDQGPAPQRDRREFSLRIQPLLRLAGPSILADIPSGKAYEEQVSATGGLPPYRFELVSGSALPAGILLRDTGRVDGTASGEGTAAFEVRVTDSSAPPQVATRTLQVTTGSCTRLCVRTRAVPDARVGTAYAYLLQSSGGTGTVTWKMESDTPPPGLALHPDTGLLSGTPTQAGQYDFTVTASDVVLDTVQVRLSLKVF